MSLDGNRDDLYFDRVDEALDLIERYDPTTLDSIRQHFAGILVCGTERFRLAHWNDNAKLCIITEPYLAGSSSSPESVASTLVHENMHARLCAAGVPYKDGRRAHIEVICAMAELAFARRLPFGSELVQRTERRIEDWASSGEAPWSNATTRDATLDHLEATGAPRLLVRFVRRLARLFRRRAA